MKIDQKKKKLRILSSKKRAILYRDNQYSSSKLVKKILEIENLDKIKIIASFISIKTEISTKPLNDFLISIGKKICLPVILNNNNYLIFRSFNKKIILIKGKYNIPIPDETREEMQKRGTHQSEWDWIGANFDYIIDNTTSLEGLNANIDQFVNQLQGRPSSNVTS